MFSLAIFARSLQGRRWICTLFFPFCHFKCPRGLTHTQTHTHTQTLRHTYYTCCVFIPNIYTFMLRSVRRLAEYYMCGDQ